VLGVSLCRSSCGSRRWRAKKKGQLRCGAFDCGRTADEIVTVPAILCALDAVQGRQRMPGCATLGSFAQGLQGQVFEHQIGLPGSDAVPENTWHPHCRTAGQRAQAVGFGGEHFGQTGVVQFDEIALPALSTRSAREIEPPPMSLTESMPGDDPLSLPITSLKAFCSALSRWQSCGLMVS
jgi:hypothetical protein